MFCSHALNEDVDFRIWVPPICDVKLTNLAITTVDDEWVLSFVGKEIVVEGSLTWPFLGATSHHCYALFSQTKLFKKLEIGYSTETCRGKACWKGYWWLGLLLGFVRHSLIVLRGWMIWKLPKDMLSWLRSLAVTSAKVSLGLVAMVLLNSDSSKKHPDLLVTPITLSFMQKHWAINFCSSEVWSDFATVIFLFCPLNFSWIWYIK